MPILLFAWRNSRFWIFFQMFFCTQTKWRINLSDFPQFNWLVLNAQHKKWFGKCAHSIACITKCGHRHFFVLHIYWRIIQLSAIQLYMYLGYLCALIFILISCSHLYCESELNFFAIFFFSNFVIIIIIL